jgi:hypothetical protein
MMRRRVIAPVSALVAVFALLFSVVMPAAAQTTAQVGSGNALKISPVRSDLEIKPGTSQTVDVFVQNLTAQQAKLHAIVNDFVANKDESGSPSIILDENKSAPVRSLRQYVEKIPDFTIQPNEQKNVKVKISIPANADAGGYFGVVRFAPASSGSDKTLTLSGSVGSLLLVKVPGDLKEQANIASFDVRKNNTASTFFTDGKKLDAVLRVKNSGNVQVQPFGKIAVKKGGETLTTYEVNNEKPRGNVLPDSIRRFDTGMASIGTFGKYTLDANLGYGSKGQLMTASTTFYIVPVPVIIIGAAVILLIAFLIFILPRLIKRYNQRVIRKATGKK